jgi:HlyD family secretion protein
MWRVKSTVLIAVMTLPIAVIAFLGGGALAASGSSGVDAIEVDLNFETQGVLTDVLVRPGERVTEGQVLARIDDGDARANLATAQAGLARARATLRQLSEGMSPAETAQARVEQEQAAASTSAAAVARSDAQALASQTSTGLGTDVGHAQSQLQALIATAAQNEVAYQAAIDQARAQLAADQTKLADRRAELVAAQAEVAAAQSRVDVAAARLAQDEAAYNQAGCPSRPSDPDCQAMAAAIQADRQELNDAQAELADAKAAVQQAQSGVDDAVDQVRLDGEAVTNAVNAQATGRLADQQAIDRGREAIEDAENAKALGRLQGAQQTDASAAALRAAVLSERAAAAANAVEDQPPTPSALAIARSDVQAAQAAVDLARLGLADTVLRAPSDGVVVAVNNAVGEVAGSTGSESSGDEGGSGVFITLAVVPEASGEEAP